MNRHDCSEQLANKEHPTLFYTEPPDNQYGRTVVRNGQWYVLNTVVGNPKGIEWNKPNQGEEYIRIPLFSYRTTTKDLTDLFSVGLHLMSTVMSHSTVDAQRIDRAHIVVGNVYDAEPDKGFQVWIGIAFHLP